MVSLVSHCMKTLEWKNCFRSMLLKSVRNILTIITIINISKTDMCSTDNAFNIYTDSDSVIDLVVENGGSTGQWIEPIF